MYHICIWQTELSPHVLELGQAFARRGHYVSMVVQEAVSKERRKEGWEEANPAGINLIIAQTEGDIECALSELIDCTHICQGFRGNGAVEYVEKILCQRGVSYIVIAEMPDDRGFKGFVRRRVYDHLLWTRERCIKALLAVGGGSSCWYVKRGLLAERVYPFAYFVRNRLVDASIIDDQSKTKFVFVGKTIKRKGIDVLLEAISDFPEGSLDIQVIGKVSSNIDAMHDQNTKNIRFLGAIPYHSVVNLIRQADYLLHPSLYDGWGVVVSEALMAGTAVICSDGCGAATAVKHAPYSEVLPAGSSEALRLAILSAIERGPLSAAQRNKIATWGHCLNAESGAHYLEAILDSISYNRERPTPPWLMGDQDHNR